jgi:hypothetical protein
MKLLKIMFRGQSLAALGLLVQFSIVPTFGEEIDLGSIQILRSQSKTYEAYDRLEQAQGSLSADGLLLKGVLLAELGRTAEAKRIFLELSKEHPGSPEPFNNLAALYAAAGDYDLALKSLHQALASQPEFLAAYENLNRVSTRMASEAYGRETGRELDEASGTLILSLLPELTNETSSDGVADAADEKRAPAEPIAALDSTAPTHPVLPVPAESVPNLDDTEFGDPPGPDAGMAWMMIREWARARASGPPEDYAAFYASDFRPSRGVSRKEWNERLLRKFEVSEPVDVHLEFLEARQTGPTQSEIRLRQTITLGSNRYSTTVTLGLVWEEDHWRIQSEYRNQ